MKGDRRRRRCIIAKKCLVKEKGIGSGERGFESGSKRGQAFSRPYQIDGDASW
jgi:hypothetical protein